MPLPAALVEGLRLLDERQTASQALKDDSIILMRLITSEDVLERVNLSDKEMSIFSLVDGQKTLGEVISKSGSTPAEVKHIAYSLEKIGLLRIKDAVHI